MNSIRFKKIIILLALPFVMEIVIACCGCSPDRSGMYSHISITLNHLENKEERPRVTRQEQIAKNAYGIYVEFYRQLFSYTPSAPSGLITNAQALHCESCNTNVRIFPKDSIEAIQIFTVNPFREDLQEGAEITHLFRVLDQHTVKTIEGFIQSDDTYADTGRSKWVVTDMDDLRYGIFLLLMEAPTHSSPHQFRIEITLSDGRVIEEETSSIELI
jgi:hypothetical protein